MRRGVCLVCDGTTGLICESELAREVDSLAGWLGGWLGWWLARSVGWWLAD